MKKKEINLLEKQRELEKKRDEQKGNFQNGIIGTILLLISSIAFYFLPQIVKGQPDDAWMKKHQNTIVIGFLVSSVIFAALSFYQYSQMKETEQKIKKIKKELGE